MPIGALAAGDQQHQAGRQVIEEELQAAIEYRPLGEVVVVEYQQQGRVGLQIERQLVEQAIEPLFEGERLVALTHLEQPEGLPAQGWTELLETFEQAFKETPGVSVALAQAEPKATPVRRQLLAELDGEGTLAEARRCVDQQQTPHEPCLQTLAQPRSRYMGLRQRRPEETPVQQAQGLTGNSMRTGQVCHGRLVLIVRLRRYGSLRD